jgi:hypothetical protein
MHATFPSKRGLAAAIVRDILLGRKSQQASATCFACGRSFHSAVTRDADGNQERGRFCSQRCREAFDAGFPAFDPFNADKWYSLPIGPAGFRIDCVHCRKQFDSRGLRCCSVECEREHCRKLELEAKLAGDPFRAEKRKCLDCGGAIPNWRNGRRVSSATRFCSDRCAISARRKNASLGSDDQNPVLSPEIVKKCPKNGGFSRVNRDPTPRRIRSPAATPAVAPRCTWNPSPNIDASAVPDIPEFLRRVPPVQP